MGTEQTQQAEQEKRITPRPIREEQAYAEVGVTEFAPGVRNMFLITFLAIIIVVPVIQLTIPAGAYAVLAGKDATEGAEEPATWLKITATVAQVSEPPDEKGVYSDFLMSVLLTDIEGLDAEEVLLSTLGMKERLILPVAGIKKGDRITVHVQEWAKVENEFSGINGSSFDDDRFLMMDTWYGEGLSIEGGNALPNGRSFISKWDGTAATIEETVAKAEKKAASKGKEFTSLKRLLAKNKGLKEQIDAYETGLDDDSILALILRPPVQHLMIKLGVGNEKAYVGRDNWLFFKLGVNSLSGPAFLDPRQIDKRFRTENVAADPRVAIIEFNKELADRGIELVLMPTPVKPSIYPEQLGNADGLIRNRSIDKFFADMEKAGVRVYDPAALLMDRKNTYSDELQYLRTDTHWAPKAMQAVAEDLAADLKDELPELAEPGYILEEQTLSQPGDIAIMLKLAEYSKAPFVETATIQSVRNKDGSGWQPSTDADVLLLGDSFSNIYSLGTMGWGSTGGFGEHLSYALGRPIDRLSRNDAGAYASREMLVDALARDSKRLDGKKFVIWQFAERELAVGDWKKLPLGAAPKMVADAGDAPPPVAVAEPVETPVPEATPVPVANSGAAQAEFKKLGESEAPAVVGKDDWIFLTSELRHLGRDPFWGEHAASEATDPHFSIVDLHKKCEEMNIKLILCPAPPRAAIYPDKILADGKKGQRVDANLQAFYEALRKDGVTVVDVTEAFIAARETEATEGVVVCEQDTHWSPRGLQIAAAAVAEEIGDMEWATPVQEDFHVGEPEELVYLGDLVERVEGHELTKTKSSIIRVSDDKGGNTPLTFDNDSPVILLSDSHGLVFSVGDDMHSTGAGFGEMLSAEIGIKIDRISRRGSGDQVRRDLARRFLMKPQDAAKKQVLIYTFAARTLTEKTNWKVVPLKR